MRIFHCDHCGNPVFFENVACLRCGHALAFVPEFSELCAIEPADDGHWKVLAPEAEGVHHRLCRNYSQENVCNWTVPANEDQALCASCRLTRIIPDLGQPGHREAWYALEVAKRRVVYSLLALGLPLIPKGDQEPRGLAFEFVDDSAGTAPRLTGHADGVITINIAEANDAEREKRRTALNEPYRTLLGHFRHETGHYYWDRLIDAGPALDGFRALFGDEQQDYSQSLNRYYEQGPVEKWQEGFISAYASAHPWEDWAETWAHYLHMTDTLETASDCGLALRPDHAELPAARPRFSLRQAPRAPFDRLLSDWLAVTFALNNLSRGLGEGDLYPFVLSNAVIEKLQFVHRVCSEASAASNTRQVADDAVNERRQVPPGAHAVEPPRDR